MLALVAWETKRNMTALADVLGRDDRESIAATDADIILSDLRLPDGDGIGLLEWMNENRYRIPFIIMTQHAEVVFAVRVMKLGAEDYLPRPFQPETLYTMLKYKSYLKDMQNAAFQSNCTFAKA